MRIPIRFGKRVAWLRSQLGLSQQQLAVEAHSTQGRIANLEKGHRHASRDEVEALARALGLRPDRLREGTDWTPDQDRAWLTANFRLVRQWLPRRRPPAPTDGRFHWHLENAGKRYPGLVRERWERIRTRPDSAQVMRFLSCLPCDSDLEALFVIGLLAVGALPFAMALSQLGFGAAAVRHPGLPPDAAEFCYPGLALELTSSLRLVFVPQVRVGRKSEPHRLDFLLGVLLSRRTFWFDLEVDGAAHDGRFDSERTLRIDLPAIRLGEKAVTARDPSEGLLGEVQRALDGAGQHLLAEARRAA